MRFRGTLILLLAAVMTGAVYMLYILPHAREQKVLEELSGRFFRVDVADVEFLRIENPHGVFNIAREGGQWKLSAPMVLPTDSRTMGSILDMITKGKIIKIITADMKRAPEFGLDTPAAALFTGYRGRIDQLVIGGSNPAGTGFYAYGKGVNAIFIVDNDVAQLATLELYDIRSKALFSFSPDEITGVLIGRREGDVELKKGKDVWQVTAPFSGRAGDEDVREFLLGVLNQRAGDFYDNTVPDGRNYGDTIRLQFTAGGRTSADIAVHYWGTGADQGVVAYQKGMAYSGRLPRDFWNFVNRDASAFRYRNLFSFDEEQIVKLTVQKQDGQYELSRNGSDWLVDGIPADGKKVTELIWFLKAWRASKLLAASDPSHREAVYQIRLWDRSGKMAGDTRIYGKMNEELIGFTEEKAQFLYYALSDNIGDPCAVSSIDLKKIPEKEDLKR